MSCSASEIIGYFSVDEHRNYVPDSSNMLYYNPSIVKAVPFDLNQNIESMVHLPEAVAAERMEHLLQWIRLNRSKIEAPVESGRWIQPNFVCSAGLFSRLLMTPSTPSDNWAIFVAKWKGTIYLYVDKKSDVNYLPEDERTTGIAWSYKFDQYILSESPDQGQNTSVPINESKEFRCVYQRRVGNHTILFDKRMRGVCSNKRLTDPLPLRELKFMNTKTSIIVSHPGRDVTLRRYKLLKWWSRAYVADIENVVCGFRDENGIVHELKTYSLNDITEMSKSYWCPFTCIYFIERLLTKIAGSVVDDCDKTIYRFSRIPEERFIIEKCIKGEKLSPSAENCILPAWYMQEAQ